MSITDSSSSNINGRWAVVRITVLLIVGVAVSCLLLLYKSTYPFQFLQTSFGYNTSPPSPSTNTSSSVTSKLIELDQLERVLQNSSMEDKTVIITTLNEAWAEPNSTFDLFFESFGIGEGTQRLLNHLLVVCLDLKAYARCLSLHPHCYALNTSGTDFSGHEAYFMTPDYLDMMWRRIQFLTSVLEKGYNFVFTDVDIMWFRDPFPRFYLDTDFQIACDNFYGNSYDVKNRPNGGFNYVKSNNRTIQFYKFWYSSRKTYPRLHDQDVLNKIKYDHFLAEIGLQIRFLDTAYFGGFCEPSKNFNLVCTMHANCCFGLGNKVKDLKLVLEDWRNFLSPRKLPQKMSWSVPKNCR